MKKTLAAMVALQLLAGCAYYQGTHTQPTVNQTTPSKNGHAVNLHSQVPNPYPQQQPSPAQTSAQMISPITH